MVCEKELLELLENITILYAEDEPNVQEDTGEVLTLLCKNVLMAKDGEEAYKIYKEKKPQIIIADINMPKMDGISLVKKIRKDDIKTAITFLTAYSDEEMLLSAANLNIQAYTLKSTLTYEKMKNILFKSINFLNLSTNLYIHITNDLLYDKTLGELRYKNNLKIKLNKKEKALMDILIENKNRLVPYKTIENYVWSGYDEVMTGSALRTIVKSLRKKVPIHFIENIARQGYKIGNIN